MLSNLSEPNPSQMARILAMHTLPLSEARDRLSSLVDQVVRTHEVITITRNGKPGAVVLSADDYDSMMETLALLNDPDDLHRLQEAEHSIAAGDVTTREEMAAILETRRRNDTE